MPEESSGYSFGNRVKLLRVTPEPKQIPIGIAARKGRLSPAAEKFWALRETSDLREMIRHFQ